MGVRRDMLGPPPPSSSPNPLLSQFGKLSLSHPQNTVNRRPFFPLSAGETPPLPPEPPEEYFPHEPDTTPPADSPPQTTHQPEPVAKQSSSSKGSGKPRRRSSSRSSPTTADGTQKRPSSRSEKVNSAPLQPLEPVSVVFLCPRLSLSLSLSLSPAVDIHVSSLCLKLFSLVERNFVRSEQKRISLQVKKDQD